MSKRSGVDATLTPKQEKFCICFVEGDNPSEAYRAAYNASNMAPDSITTEAQRLLKDKRVQDRITELRNTLQRSLGLSRVSLLMEIDEIKELARGRGDV